jgi:hypothetical protein
MNETLLDQPSDQTQLDPDKKYLEELVGEGKKFKTVEDLARGKYEADNFVETLKARSDQLREDYLKLREESSAKANLQELLDQLKAQQLASSAHTTANEVTEKPGFDPKQIESLVASKVQEFDTTRREQDNFNLVKSKIKEKYGDNPPASLRQQIEKLGPLGSDLAKKYPDEFLKVLGLTEQAPKETYQSPPRGTVRTDTFKPTGTEKRTWSYYQKLKKENPNLYYDRKIAVQMHNDALSLGEEFQDGDFNAM